MRRPPFLKNERRMKKKRVTYGISGMMEYQATIRVGRAMMKVPFSDGTMTAMGVNPAKFTTDNYMVQHAIEQSADYKRGRIYKVNTIELDDEVRIERNELPATGSRMNDTPNKADRADKADKSDESDEPEVSEVQMVKRFACNDDARDYLESAYGVTRSKMRTRADIQSYGRANGVEIEFE